MSSSNIVLRAKRVAQAKVRQAGAWFRGAVVAVLVSLVCTTDESAIQLEYLDVHVL